MDTYDITLLNTKPEMDKSFSSNVQIYEGFTRNFCHETFGDVAFMFQNDVRVGSKQCLYYSKTYLLIHQMGPVKFNKLPR